MQEKNKKSIDYLTNCLDEQPIYTYLSHKNLLLTQPWLLP